MAKKVVTEKFVPELDARYWFVDDEALVRYETNDGEQWDKNRIRIGNCFKNRTQAREAAAKLKAVFSA